MCVCARWHAEDRTGASRSIQVGASHSGVCFLDQRVVSVFGTSGRTAEFTPHPPRLAPDDFGCMVIGRQELDNSRLAHISSIRLESAVMEHITVEVIWQGSVRPSRVQGCWLGLSHLPNACSKLARPFTRTNPDVGWYTSVWSTSQAWEAKSLSSCRVVLCASYTPWISHAPTK